MAAGAHMDGCSSKAVEDELMGWAVRCGMKMNHEFQMADFKEGGRGCAALTSIPKGVELCEIPSSLFFGLKAVGCQPVLGDMETLDTVLNLLRTKDPDAALVATWQIQLALLILIEKHKHGDRSSVKPYIDSLPTTEPSLDHWADDEFGDSSLDAIQLPRISNWLRGKRAMLHQVWENCVVSEEMRGRGFDCFGGHELPFNELLWALRCVSSRSYQIIDARVDRPDIEINPLPETGADEEQEDKRVGMFPILDLFNHNDEPNVLVSYRPARSCFVVEVLRDVVAGEQLTRSYGPAPNAFYFITYGFVPPANHHNTLMVDLSDEMERLEMACREEHSAGREEEEQPASATAAAAAATVAAAVRRRCGGGDGGLEGGSAAAWASGAPNTELREALHTN